jgi:hypothetical protein
MYDDMEMAEVFPEGRVVSLQKDRGIAMLEPSAEYSSVFSAIIETYSPTNSAAFPSISAS